MKKFLKREDIKTNKLLKVIVRWKNITLNVVNGQIHSLDCFQFSDDTYCYDYTSVNNKEAVDRNKDKNRYTLDELNNIWKDTPMAKAARREISPFWEAKNVKCSCGTDFIGGGIHSDYCDKSKHV